MVQNTAVTKLKKQVISNRQKSKPIEVLIQQSMNELGKALPSHLSADRLVRIALTTIRLNPKLADCTPQSFLGALFQSAQLGLEPNVEGQAYIIPYLNSKKVFDEETGKDKWVKVMEAQFQIGYKGYIELFYRSQNAFSLDMHTIYEKDTFEYGYGTDAYLKHTPAFGSDRGKAIGYYAIAKLVNGGNIFKVMSKEECIEHAKKHSKSFDGEKFSKNSPWLTDEDAMCKKTVLIQLIKLLPKSIEIQKALAMDETTKSRISADMLEVADETDWDSEETKNFLS